MDFGAPELLIVLVIVILLFGPGRIANLSGELGKGIRSFKEGLNAGDEPSNETQVEEKSDQK
jgi:sec-independent protein translocase protein TatA